MLADLASDEDVVEGGFDTDDSTALMKLYRGEGTKAESATWRSLMGKRMARRCRRTRIEDMNVRLLCAVMLQASNSSAISDGADRGPPCANCVQPDHTHDLLLFTACGQAIGAVFFNYKWKTWGDASCNNCWGRGAHCPLNSVEV